MLALVLRKLLGYLLLRAADRVSPQPPGAQRPGRPVPQPVRPVDPLGTHPEGRRERILEGAVGNGIGTVVAALVVYLGAAAAGLVSANPRPVLVALVPLAVGVGAWLGRAWVRVPRVTVRRVLLAGFVPPAVVLAVVYGANALLDAARVLGESAEALAREATSLLESDPALAVEKADAALDIIGAAQARHRGVSALLYAAGALHCSYSAFWATVVALGRGRVVSFLLARPERWTGLSATLVLVALTGWAAWELVALGLSFPPEPRP